MSTQPSTRSDSSAQSGGERRCLVVGYDREPAAERALRWAVRQLPADGRLVIVFACRGLHVRSLQSERERRSFAGATIDELLLEADDALLDREIVTEISDEDPVHALRDAAERHNAEAIVLGAQRHSSLQRAIGTVTSELLKHSRVAITVVPAS